MQTVDPIAALKIAEAAYDVAVANHRALSDEYMKSPCNEELRSRVLALSDIAYDAKIALHNAERVSGLHWTLWRMTP